MVGERDVLAEALRAIGYTADEIRLAVVLIVVDDADPGVFNGIAIDDGAAATCAGRILAALAARGYTLSRIEPLSAREPDRPTPP